MKKPKSSKPHPKAPTALAPAKGSAFSEPPPDMDVNDPRWPDAFSRWVQRKAKSMGMDPIEMMGRALGLDKEADGWRKRQAELRHREQHANDIYGKPPNNEVSERGPDAPAT